MKKHFQAETNFSIHKKQKYIYLLSRANTFSMSVPLWRLTKWFCRNIRPLMNRRRNWRPNMNSTPGLLKCKSNTEKVQEAFEVKFIRKHMYYTYKKTSTGYRNTLGTFFIIGKITQYAKKMQKTTITIWESR